jgi:hypothetical protein
VLRRRWLSRGNIIGFGTSCGEEMRARERVVWSAGRVIWVVVVVAVDEMW